MVGLDIATNTLKSLPPRCVDLEIPYFSAAYAPYAALGLFGGTITVTVILLLVLVLIYPTRVFRLLWTEEMVHDTYNHGSVCRQL